MTLVVIALALLLVGAAIFSAVWYVKREQSQSRADEFSAFRSEVLLQLRKRGPKALNLEALVAEYEVPDDMAHRVATSLYSSSCTLALEDAVITAAEREYLLTLQKALAISNEDAGRLEKFATENRYRAAVREAMADSIITAEEAEDLKRLRDRFGLSTKRAVELIGDAARDGYRALFQEVIRDGRITAEELHQLKQYRDALGLSKREANVLSQTDALLLYRRWLFNILQDGDVSEEEERGLAWIREEFGLDSGATKVYDEQLQEAKALAGFRRGELPALQSSKLLQGGEICHWEGKCTFQWETTTKLKDSTGELVLTSQQLIFSSPLRSFSLSPSRVLDITLYSDCLVIKSSSNRGSGNYFIRAPKMLEAILVGLVKKHKFQLCANYSSDKTRHVADSVRREVWQRDGGKCVRCQAADYLEYDHIIPYSRGGANTVANIQILCRRCNNLKKDRI